MKKFLFSTLFCSFFCSIIIAQSLGDYYYGDFKNDFIQSTLLENDTTLLTVGAKKNLSNNYEVWFQKINLKTMKPTLEKTFTINNSNFKEQFGYAMTKTKDNGYLIGGSYTDGSFFSRGGALYKIKNDGSLEWVKTFDKLKTMHGVKENDTGNYFICGTNNTEGILINVNSKGETLWLKTYEENYRTIIKNIYDTPDNKLLLFGRTGENAVGFHGVFIVKTEKDGNVIWKKKYDTQFDDFQHSSSWVSTWIVPLGVAKLNDGNYIVVNSEDENGTTILKINPDGNLIWKKNINSTAYKADIPLSVQNLSNGNLLICGEAGTSEGGYQAFSLTTNEFGKEINRKYYGLNKGSCRFFSATSLPNNNFLFAGDKSDLAGNNDARGWINISDNELNSFNSKVETEVILDLNKNCQKDAQDIPLENWYLKTNKALNSIILSNAKGQNTITFEKDTLNIELINTNANLWTICKSSFSTIYDKNKPIQKITFFVQVKESCPKPEISITQPELVRCQNARYFVTIQNHGMEDSEDLVAQITLDKHLELITASLPYTKNNNVISFNINKLSRLESQTFELLTKLSCNAQLSAAHLVKAELLPLECVPIWVKEKIEVEGKCENNLITFTCKNTGNENMEIIVPYTIWQNQFILKKGFIQLKKGENKIFTFAANGDTYHFECGQVQGYPFESYPNATIEGCGVNKTGLFKVGFAEAFRQNDATPNLSYAIAMNGVGGANKVAELSGKFGVYHYFRDLGYQEFCARARNTTGKTQDSVEFDINFNSNFDISSLQILGANNFQTLKTSIQSNGNLTLKMKDLSLSSYEKDATKSDVFVRFKIKPKANLINDESSNSHLLIKANAYFNEQELVELYPAWANYYINNQDTLAPKNILPENVLTYGGKYSDYSNNILKDKHNNLFITGVSFSYSAVYEKRIFINKTDSKGKIIWQKLYDEGDTYISKCALNSNDEIIITGSFLPKDSVATLSAYEVFVAKIDNNGNLIWKKRFKPGTTGKGGLSQDLINTTDNAILISGYCNNEANAVDNYLIKLDQEGNIIWKKNYVVNGIAFHGEKVKELPDKTYLVAGSEDSFNSYPIYYQKIDNNGNEIWSRFYVLPDSVRSYYFADVMPHADSSITFIAYSFWQTAQKEYVITPYFIKFDKNGKKILEKRPIVGVGKFFESHGYLIKDENEFYVYGETYKDTTLETRSDFGLALFDKNFNLKSLNTYGTANTEWPEDAVYINKDTIALWGFHQASQNDDNLDCVLAFAYINNKGVSTNEAVDFPQFNVVCYPNPSQNGVNFDIKNIDDQDINAEIFIYNSSGALVTKQKITATKSINFDVSNWQSGIYLYQIKGKDKAVYTDRFIVIH